jgi:hypothetical protein
MQEIRQEKSQIKQKILLYLKEKGISSYDFYKKSGVTRGVLSQSNGISEENLARFLAYSSDVNVDWLLTGTGSMLKPNNIDSGTIVSEPIGIEDINSATSVKEIPDTESVTAPTKPTIPTTPTGPTKELIPLTQSKEKLLDVSEIPLYNIDASAGLNKLFADGGELLGKISIPNAPRCDGAVHVIGDSMSPLLKSGDIIAYRIVNDLQSINFGEVYILQLSNNGDTYIVVKYVKRSDVGSDHIRLVSYNKEYDPKDVPLSWIQAIARVTFCIRRFSII